MNQMPLFDKKDAGGPRTVTVKYSSSDFNAAIADAHEAHGEQTAVIAIPVDCRLLQKRAIKKKGAVT